MPAEEFFFYTTFGLLILNLAVVVYIHSVYKKNLQLEKTIYQNGSNVLREAQLKAKEVIDSAIAKAKQILTESEYLSKDLTKKMEDGLDHVAQSELSLLEKQSIEIERWYQKLYTQVQTAQLKTANQTIAQMEKMADKEIFQFGQQLEKETTHVESEVTKKVQQEYEKAKQEIDAYKTAQLEQVRIKALALIHQVVAEVLRDGISPGDQERLILQSLEKAKQEKVFESFHSKE